jgi:hypothetical protein
MPAGFRRCLYATLGLLQRNFNNHYAGYGPGTVKLFWDEWKKK